MKLIYLLPIASLIAFHPTIASALSPAQIQSIAKSVTLKIEATGGGKPDAGSGVIIQKQGNNYILATNAHVVCGNSGYLIKCSKHTKYNIVTPDGKSHSATDTAVKLLPDLDLAIVELQSERNYPVATLGDSDKLKIDAPIYAAGFPASKGFSFNSGSIVANGKTRLEDDNGGYIVIYDAATKPGMSGGGVFDLQGQLIAIHGNGDKYPQGSETSIGFDRYAREFSVSTSFGKLSDARSKTEDFKGALTDINKAIELNPNYALAYAARYSIYSRINKPSMATADLNRAISLDPDNHQYIFARAASKFSTSDLQGAKQDADLAIATAKRTGNYDYAEIYQKYLGLAVTQYSQSQSGGKNINPSIVIPPNPDTAESYLISANQKKSKGDLRGDLRGALADYNKAVEIQPTVLALLSRAGFKEKELKDLAGAEADISRAIELQSENPYYYLLRVNLRRLNKNRQGAIADLEQAAKLYKQIGDEKNYSLMQQFIQYFPNE